MPGDEVTAAQIAAAGQVAASTINYASASSANRKGRRWALEQYNRERENALTDWSMQNEYNSPAAQMARLKAAGLNPNLVYGDGATQASSSVRGADASWKPDAPQFDAAGAANSILAIAGQKLTAAQTDNVKANKVLIDLQAIETAARTQNIGAMTETSQFNLDQLKQKASTDIAQVKANLDQTYVNTEKTRADTQFTLDQNERAAAVNSVSIKEALQKISNMRLEALQIQANTGKTNQDTQNSKHQLHILDQTLSNLQVQNKLHELDLKMKQEGIQPHDPAWQRAVQKFLQEKVPTPQKFNQMVNDFLKGIGSYTPLNPIPQP